MKKIVCGVLVLVYILAGSGIIYAQEETKAGSGAVVGGLLGAVTGGVIGRKKHKTTEGVLIGGAVGALGGAAVGSQMKKDVPPPTRDVPAKTQVISGVDAHPAKVTMGQVVYWSEQEVPAGEIIARVESSRSVFVLTDEDVRYLQEQGVSQRVIEAMQQAR
jgi:hypothetical protein